jgi:PKD repeat protein
MKQNKLKKLTPLWSFFILALFCQLEVLGQRIPEPLSPFQNERTASTSVFLYWTSSPYGNELYDTQVSTDSLFSSIIFQQSGISSSNLLVSGLVLEQQYFWRVRSITGTEISEWSETRTFFCWSPSVLTGLVVWIDPNEPMQLNGSTVSLTGDGAGLGNQAGQSNAGQMPALVTLDSAINLRKSIAYDGIDDFLEIQDNASIDFSDEFSALLLVKPTTIAVNKTMLAKWDYQTQGSWAFQTDFSTNDELMFAPALNISDVGNQKVVSTDADMLLSEPVVLNLEYNGNLSNKVRYFKNNSLLTSTVVNTIPSSLPNSSATLKIGKYGGIATRYYQGHIGEVLIYDRALDSIERATLMEYYRYKYAPPVSLGNDTIISTNSFCGNLTLRANYRFKTYQWSTGSNSSSIVVNSPGLYWLTATDYFGNTTTDSIKVYPPFNINVPASDQLCLNATMTWAPSYDPGQFSFNWSTGSTAPSIVISQAGTYSVTITDGSACSFQSEPYTVAIDNYEITAFLGNDTSLCTGNLLALQVGAPETITYAWQGASPSNQPNYVVGATGNYWVESVNENGCVAQDTIFITNFGIAPVVDFSAADHCLNSMAPLLDQSMAAGSDALTLWQWNMGDGANINQQAPGYTYLSPGTYAVELYVQALSGCGAHAYDTVTVFPSPNVSYTFLGHCANQDIQFTGTSSSNVQSFSWDFGMPWTGVYNTASSSDPIRIFNQDGNYEVKLVITDINGCLDSLIQTIVIDPSPVPDFVYQSACQGSPIQFVNTSVTQPSSTYFWDFNDNTSSVLINPEHTYTEYGAVPVELTITNVFSCQASIEQLVDVAAFPVVSMNIGPACMGSYVTLENTSTVPFSSIDSTIWVINQTDTLYGLNSVWMVDALGQHQVEVFTWSAAGCASQGNQFLDVNVQFDASFETGSGIIAAEQPFTFENTSNPGSIALWTFGDGGFSTEFSPEYTYDTTFEDSTLEVTLIAMNTTGCIDTSIQIVEIRRASIDLEIDDLFLQNDNGFYTMGINLKNIGTVNLDSAYFIVETQNGFIFSEIWNGVLKPDEDSVYVFSGMPISLFNDQDNKEYFICISGVAYDVFKSAETNLNNNRVCRNIEGEGSVLFPVFPNPATDECNIRIFLTENTDVHLSIYDSRGRSVLLIEQNPSLPSGYYEFKVRTEEFSDGIYYIQLQSAGKILTKKILVNN